MPNCRDGGRFNIFVMPITGRRLCALTDDQLPMDSTAAIDGVVDNGGPFRPVGRIVQNDPNRTLAASKSRGAARPDLMLANPLFCRSMLG
jgi:hypothetical protein